MRFLVKILLTSLIVALVSELGKKSSAVAAILASLPLTSILAMIWLYGDTGDATQVANLSVGIFWAVLPSLLFFVVLPLLLRSGVSFVPAMFASCVVMVAGYAGYAALISKVGLRL